MSKEEEPDVLVAGLVWDKFFFADSWDCFDCVSNQSMNSSGYRLRGNSKIRLCARCLHRAKDIEKAIEEVEIDIRMFEDEGCRTDNIALIEGARTAREQLDKRLSGWQAKVKQAY